LREKIHFSRISKDGVVVKAKLYWAAGWAAEFFELLGQFGFVHLCVLSECVVQILE
jgi:hypothetical protein